MTNALHTDISGYMRLDEKIEYSINLLRKSEEMAFNWWISGKSFDKFYADEYLQQKIEF